MGTIHVARRAKERRGKMEGREAHYELWWGYRRRETYTHFYKVFKGVQILWNTHRKHTTIMLCALRFQGACAWSTVPYNNITLQIKPLLHKPVQMLNNTSPNLCICPAYCQHCIMANMPTHSHWDWHLIFRWSFSRPHTVQYGSFIKCILEDRLLNFNQTIFNSLNSSKRKCIHQLRLYLNLQYMLNETYNYYIHIFIQGWLHSLRGDACLYRGQWCAGAEYAMNEVRIARGKGFAEMY